MWLINQCELTIQLNSLNEPVLFEPMQRLLKLARCSVDSDGKKKPGSAEEIPHTNWNVTVSLLHDP